MKISYIKSITFLSVALMAASCTENSWNNTFLDGFDGDVDYSGKTVNMQYTMTKTNYETLGRKLYNAAQTQDQMNAANSIRNNHYFDQDGIYPYQVAVPEFLNDPLSAFYALNNNSTVEVTLEAAEVPDSVMAITNAKTMTVPEGTAVNTIPSKLASTYPNAQEGDYAIVTVGDDSGSSSSDWTVAEALSQIASGYTGNATVKGIISSISDIDTGTYGNATYFIKDDLNDTESLEVYRGYYLEGAKFTSTDQLQVGATVVVSGSLVNYNGTFEFTSGSKILSYEAPATKSRSTRAALTSNIKDLTANSTLTATAIVTAQSGRGVILTDNAGSIFYYNNNVDLDTYTIGTVVNVSGTVSVYGTGFQLSNTATISVVGSETYTYPTPTVYTAAMIESAIGETTPNTAKYVTIEGELSVNSSYYNINIPGVSNGQGSLYTPTDDLKDELTSGSSYKFTGYFTGVTSGKYFYMVITEVEAISGGNTGGNNPGDDNPGSGDTGGNTGGSTNDAQNMIYRFNDGKWTLAKDAVVMNPEDYTALGLKYNSLSEPGIYLPIFLKNKYPYTKAGTIKYVAYNLVADGCACGMLEYDGYNWNYVDSYIETVTAVYIKKNGSYKFLKKLGEEVYNLYVEDKIGMDCDYLIVYNDLCMAPVPASNTYGYPGETPVTIENDQIVMTNSNNAFTFATTTEYNGNVYTTPAGYFVILDSNGRYMYLQGTYSSFNLRSGNAYINNDGTISPQYLFTATKNADGTWSIVNKQDIERTLYYSNGNADFAAYTKEQLIENGGKYDGKLPYLYISATSEPNTGDNGSAGQE